MIFSQKRFLMSQAGSATGGGGGGGGGIQQINGDSGFISASTSTLTGGTTGLVFNGNVGHDTLTMVANFLALPATDNSGNGQVLINGNRFVSTSHGASDDSSNTFIGANAGSTTNPGGPGDGNTCVGKNAGSQIDNGGVSNTHVGINAGLGVTGNSTTYIGAGAGSGSGTNANNNNVGIGASALAGVATNSADNVAVGTGSMSASGCQSPFNVAIGSGSLNALTSFSQQLNIAIGYLSGSALATGAESKNILIGTHGVTGDSTTTRIGYVNGTAPTQTACFIDGIDGVVVTGAAVLVATGGQLGVAASSKRFKENINDMGSSSDILMSLRPVTFNYKKDTSKAKSFGLIAEEVNELMPELVQLDKEGVPFTVKYNELPAMLLNEIQKLNKRIEELERKIK